MRQVCGIALDGGEVSHTDVFRAINELVCAVKEIQERLEPAEKKAGDDNTILEQDEEIERAFDQWAADLSEHGNLHIRGTIALRQIKNRVTRIMQRRVDGKSAPVYEQMRIDFWKRIIDDLVATVAKQKEKDSEQATHKNLCLERIERDARSEAEKITQNRKMDHDEVFNRIMRVALLARTLNR